MTSRDRSGHPQSAEVVRALCPLHPRERTCVFGVSRSQKCQNRKSADTEIRTRIEAVEHVHSKWMAFRQPRVVPTNN